MPVDESFLLFSPSSWKYMRVDKTFMRVNSLQLLSLFDSGLNLFSIARATGDEAVAKRFWEQLELQLPKLMKHQRSDVT